MSSTAKMEEGQLTSFSDDETASPQKKKENKEKQKKRKSEKKQKIRYIQRSPPVTGLPEEIKGEVLVMGRLQKKGFKRHNWKKRFFVIFKSDYKYIYYFKKPVIKKKNLKGVIFLRRDFKVEDNERRKFCFQIKTAMRKWTTGASKDAPSPSSVRVGSPPDLVDVLDRPERTYLIAAFSQQDKDMWIQQLTLIALMRRLQNECHLMRRVLRGTMPNLKSIRIDFNSFKFEEELLLKLNIPPKQEGSRGPSSPPSSPRTPRKGGTIGPKEKIYIAMTSYGLDVIEKVYKGLAAKHSIASSIQTITIRYFQERSHHVAGLSYTAPALPPGSPKGRGGGGQDEGKESGREAESEEREKESEEKKPDDSPQNGGDNNNNKAEQVKGIHVVVPCFHSDGVAPEILERDIVDFVLSAVD